MRERLDDEPGETSDMRITPARAGKTLRRRRHPRRFPDHSRSCGKDFATSCEWGNDSGSLPLVRERLGNFYALFCENRITPARAGKTFQLVTPFMIFEDHSRSCGKDKLLLWTTRRQWGSLPLVRERRNIRLSIKNGVRITPARAGKTKIQSSGITTRKDHSRSCGKDANRFITNYVERGSLPLVRERPAQDPGADAGRRITPARAGKTVMDSFIFALLRLLTFKIYSTSLPNI